MAISGAAGVGGLSLGAGSLAYVMRRISHDRAEMAKERANTEVLANLRIERDDARAERLAAINELRTMAIAARADAQTIATLTAHNIHQAAEVERLHDEHDSFRRMIARKHPDAIDDLGTDLAPLGRR